MKTTWPSTLKTEQMYTCFLLQHLLLICKVNEKVGEKGSKLPYKLALALFISDVDTVAYSLNTKAKSGIVIQLHNEGLIQLNAANTEDAKSWVTELQLAESMVSKS